MSKNATLEKRAIAAIKAKATSDELYALYTQIANRLSEIDQEAVIARSLIDNPPDLDSLHAARNELQALKDEELTLRARSGELYKERKVALGAEALEKKPELDKTLADTLVKAQRAQALLSECKSAVRQLCQARRDAAEIGETLTYDIDAVRALAEALYADSNELKQCKIDLGAARARRMVAA